MLDPEHSILDRAAKDYLLKGGAAIALDRDSAKKSNRCVRYRSNAPQYRDWVSKDYIAWIGARLKHQRVARSGTVDHLLEVIAVEDDICRCGCFSTPAPA